MMHLLITIGIFSALTHQRKSFGYGVQPCGLDGGGNPAGIASYSLRNAACVDFPGGCRGRPQQICLGISPGFQPAAAMKIATAGGQKLLETLGPAIDIRRRQ